MTDYTLKKVIVNTIFHLQA